MANRQTLHRSKLDAFREWLPIDGWSVEKTNGSYEVIRARKGKRVLLIYDRHEGNHLSYADQFHGVVMAFVRSTKTR